MKTKLFAAAMAVTMLAVSACGTGSQKGTAASDTTTANASDGITNPVIENIMSRRSIRAYKPTPVSRDTMEVILKCGINAPNAMNRQSWEVRVVDNADMINEITKAFVAQNPKMAEAPGFVNMFRNAPSVIFVANEKASGMSQVDCGLLGENIMLAANSLGIGTCCLGGPVRFINSEDGRFFLEKLGFSEGYELLYAIAIGYPDQAPDAKPRDAEKVKFVD